MSNLLTLWRQEKKKKRGQIIRLGVLLEGCNNLRPPSTNHPHANWPVVLPLPIQPIGWSRANHADGGWDRHTRWAYQLLLTSNGDNRETGKRVSEIVQVCLAHQVTHTHTRVHIHSLRYVCRSTHAPPLPLCPDILKAKKKKEKRHLLVKLRHARG